MAISSIRTLLIEDNPADALVLREALADVPEAGFELEWVDGLAKGLHRLNAGHIDLLLLDLHLPESRGLATFATAHDCAPGVPVIVLTGLDDRELALKAVRDGAQDYLVKGQFEAASLVRAMQHALVRHRMQAETVGPTWKDELTGLYNRHGFLVLGEQLLRLADNAKCTLTLLYADIDGMESFNQTCGREAGDEALLAVSGALRRIAGESDLVARVGEDEFVLMGISHSGTPRQDVKTMLDQELRKSSDQQPRACPLAVNWGVSIYDPGKPTAIAVLMKRAEAQVHPGPPCPAA